MNDSTSKPVHLSRFYAEQFQEKSVVNAYAHRPPIPDPVFDVLRSLLVDAPRRLLDAGCGTGAVARRLAPLVDHVDAVDFSDAQAFDEGVLRLLRETFPEGTVKLEIVGHVVCGDPTP